MPGSHEEGQRQPATSTASATSSGGHSSALARRALFAAVEGGSDGTDDVLSCGPLVRLFFRDECSSKGDNDDDEDDSEDDDINDDLLPGAADLSERERQSLLLGAVRTHKFHRGHARRLFAGLAGTLRSVVENEEYVPASAYENDDDDDEEEDNNNNVEEDGDDGTNMDGEGAAAAAAGASEAAGQRPARRTSFGSSIMAGGGPGGTVAAHEIAPDAASTRALLFMRSCCLLTEAYLRGLVERRSDPSSSAAGGNADREYGVIDEAFQVAELLHDALFSLQSCGPVAVRVQSSISAMCEYWWHSSFEGREQLVTMLVPLLVAKTLDGAAAKSDVKRLHAIRDALDLLDFADPSIDYLRSLLLRTASSPHYLRTAEGRRIIAHLFRLDADLVGDLHRSIRVQIPDAKKTILDSYGDIYLRAWRDAAAAVEDSGAGSEEEESADEIRVAIEENALQDLMMASLHVADPKLARSVRVVLTPLHRAKKSPDVDQLLHRMYGPILWRALAAANPLVRLNATPVLADTFPLRDPDEGEDRTEAVVGKTVDVLTSLLRDPEPRVRVAASHAAGRILASFWDVLQTADIRRLLNEIITKHSSDASSAAVRAESVATVGLLLEAEHSRAVLRPLLPSLGNLIHDRVEKVRVSVVRMLLKIKKIRGLKYYHVVPVEHLLARLQAEGEVLDSPTSAVATELTGLMLNSYFPQGDGVTGADQMKRTLTFLTNNDGAASIFYQNIAYHLSIGSVAKLAAMLLQCLSAAIDADAKETAAAASKSKKKRSKKRGRDENNSDDEEDGSSGGDKTLNASNTKLMAAIAETICCLWESISPSLAEADNEKVNDFLADAFSGSVLTDALSHFEQKHEDAVKDEDKVQQMECRRICSAILRCAGNLTPAVVDGLSFRISTMEVTENTNLTAHMALLCVWGMEEDVAKAIGKSIKQGLMDETDEDAMMEEPRRQSTKRNARSEKRKGEVAEDDMLPFANMPASLAIASLSNILRGVDPSCVAARDAILDSASACSALEGALDAATSTAERMLTNSDYVPESDKVALVLACCEEFGKLALHKEGRKTVQSSQLSSPIQTLLYWVSSRVIPAVAKHSANNVDGGENDDGTSPLGDLNLSRISLSSNVSSLGPMSPAEPAKRRSNRGKTPKKQELDSTFEADADKSVSFDIESATNVPIAICLIKSALVVFAEWVSVCGIGSKEIAAKASKWVTVLQMECVEVDIRKELIPAFTRLAFQLARKGGDSKLGAAVVYACMDHLDEGCEQETRVKKMASKINKLAEKENGTGMALIEIQ